jgi:hypothetical protein
VPRARRPPPPGAAPPSLRPTSPTSVHEFPAPPSSTLPSRTRAPAPSTALVPVSLTSASFPLPPLHPRPRPARTPTTASSWTSASRATAPPPQQPGSCCSLSNPSPRPQGRVHLEPTATQALLPPLANSCSFTAASPRVPLLDPVARVSTSSSSFCHCDTDTPPVDIHPKCAICIVCFPHGHNSNRDESQFVSLCAS